MWFAILVEVLKFSVIVQSHIMGGTYLLMLTVQAILITKVITL